LHGCLQYYGQIGPAFVGDAGINQWADTNRIIVLYPQTIATAVTNGEGCWDWWGYLNDPNYAQRSGPQMQALYSMVARAAGLTQPLKFDGSPEEQGGEGIYNHRSRLSKSQICRR